MSLIVDRRNVEFLLYEVFDSERICNSLSYNSYDRETVCSVLDLAQSIAEAEYLPIASLVDTNEPEIVDGKPVTPRETKEALRAYADAGFFSATFPSEIGGMEMPWHIYTQVTNMFSCANTSVHGYSLLTTATANVIEKFGSDTQKSLFLKPLLEGRWFGTMCLSEPHAGSSLADLSTKALPTHKEHFLISGTKMWISGGDQDISENIVHLVLARLPDAPPGVRGISLFIVPKIRVDQSGGLGVPNDVTLVGLNHKMGHRGTINTVLCFGDNEDCHGYLIGEPNKGLRYMFHMMNEARIAIGQGATMCGLGGFLHSLEYAKQREQGRLPGNKNPLTPPVPIIEHADVKRLLMAQKAFVEGASCLIAYCAQLVDETKLRTSSRSLERCTYLLEILTPIAKSWPSEFCLEANKLAMQVLGGYGYTRDFPLERYYRDNRLNPIHEGVHAIHGIDLLGRKVQMENGAALSYLIHEMQETIEQAQSNTDIADLATELSVALKQLIELTYDLLNESDLNKRLSNATMYLDAFGHIVIAWMWLLQVIPASRQLANESSEDRDFYQGKIAACRYFFAYELPLARTKLEIVGQSNPAFLSSDARHFSC